jgi:hypothetical protein
LEGQELTQKKSYSRYFIILQEDEKGYALASDKLPSGYAKLEIKNDKCKVSYYVQNLKKESAPYYMVLICNKKDAKKLLKLGELNIDEHGRAEVFHEYPVENVGNCGVSVDKVVGASIVRTMSANIIPIMSGFTSTDIPEWKSFPMIEEEQRRQDEDRLDKQIQPAQVQPTPVKPAAEETPIVEEAPIAEEIPIMEETPAPEQAQQPTNIFDEYEMKIEAEIEQQPVEHIQEAEIDQPNNNAPLDMMNNEYMDLFDDRHKKKDKKHEECEDSKHHDNKKHEECEDNKHHDNKKHEECKDNKHHDNKKHEYCKKDCPKGSVGAFFMDVADGFEELENICSEIKRCKWYKVPVQSPQSMNSCVDYNKHNVVYYPMMNYYQYIARFGHFILGYKMDKENKMKYLVYGIPGTKSREDQPFGGRTGFVTWVPLNEGEEDEDSYGYWLMFYDFRSSTIVIPVQ